MRNRTAAALITLLVTSALVGLADDLEMRDGEYYANVLTNPRNAGGFGSNAGFVYYKVYFGERSLQFSALDGKDGKYMRMAEKVSAPKEFEIPYADMANAVRVIYPDALHNARTRVLILGTGAKEKLRTQDLVVHRSEKHLDKNEVLLEGDWLDVMWGDQSLDFFSIEGGATYLRNHAGIMPMGWLLVDCDLQEAALVDLFYNRKADKGKLALGVVLVDDPLYDEFFTRLKAEIQRAGSAAVASASQ